MDDTLFETEDFETEDVTIDLEQVAALEEADPAGRTLHVLLKDGSNVPVRGEDEVQAFVQALDEHLEPDGEL